MKGYKINYKFLKYHFQVFEELDFVKIELVKINEVKSCLFVNYISFSFRPFLLILLLFIVHVIVYIVKKCRKAMLNLQRIRQIRKYPTQEAVQVLVHSTVISHLDYGNVLFDGLPKSSLRLLQKVQNYAAKVVLCKKKSDSMTECMKILHWLPCEKRSEFKALCLVYNSLHNNAPSYLMKTFALKNKKDKHSDESLPPAPGQKSKHILIPE